MSTYTRRRDKLQATIDSIVADEAGYRDIAIVQL
jgi:hypothetical protein